jgi:hypothetical protein
MPDRVIEETESGYQRIARTQLLHRGPDGSFVSAEAFLRARNAEICQQGYGQAGYGASGYGE